MRPAEPGDRRRPCARAQIWHARTAFEDWEEPARKRHLLRLWLSLPDGRELPPVWAERYGNIERGTVRGGIRVAGVQPCAPLAPA